ncbi:MAG: hypothetical protein Tsb0014_28350 [Pleurocapsa sp.]
MASKHQQLPEEIIQPATSSKILLSLILPWILFAIANLAANFYLNYFPQNRGYWLIKQKWDMLLNLNKPVDFLVLGDSSCNQGIVPKVIESELNTNAVNLCTIGDSLALNDAWMLSKHIKKYGAPKNVLIVHVYDMWSRDINWNVTSQTPLSWGYWNQLEPHITVDFEQQKTIFLNQYLPLYSQNKSLKKIIDNPDRWFVKKDYNLQPDGFMAVTHSNSGEVEEDTKRHLRAVNKKQEFSLSPVNKRSLEAILKLAEEHNFNVYLANSPIYQELYQKPEFKTYYHQVQQKLQEFSERSAKIHYIMSDPMTFPKESMENADHLIESAAKTYTQKLASKINEVETYQSINQQ